MTEKAYRNQIRFLVVLSVISALLVLSVLVWGWKYAPGYQSLTSNVTPASTPASLEELTTRVELLEKIQNQNLKAFEWQLDQKLVILGLVAVLISTVSASIGIKTYNDLDKVIKERISATLTKELYQRDVSNQKIWLFIDPGTEEDMEAVETRLTLSGLTFLEPITKLDKKSFQGITVVPIFDEKMEDQFADYLERNKKKLNSLKAAFVLYTKSHRVKDATFEKFINMVPANMPVTVASNILTVARGLVDESHPKNKEEQ